MTKISPKKPVAKAKNTKAAAAAEKAELLRRKAYNERKAQYRAARKARLAEEARVAARRPKKRAA